MFRTASFVVLLAATVSLVDSNDLSCFSCEDCTKERPIVVECRARVGIDLNALSYTPTYPVLTQSTPPAWGGSPWDPNLTPPPLVGGNNGGNPWDPNLTPPPLVGGNNGGNPWDPNLTPPPLAGGNNGNPWNPNLTPPPLAGGMGNGNPWDPNLTPPPLVGGYNPWNRVFASIRANRSRRSQKQQYVCVTIRSQDKTRTQDIVHRRGCAEIEAHAADICEREHIPLHEGGITSCRVCRHSLCNE